MTEDFLHYVWQYKLFNLNNIIDTHSNPIEVIFSGYHNKESGPDFFNAKIKIDGLLWVGNVEIHINSSDWYKHQHETDPAYSNTILHVVYNHDMEVLDVKKRAIPTIELNGRIAQKLTSKYSALQLSTHQLVCQNHTENLDPFKTEQWLSRLLIERLERKVIDIQEIHNRVTGNWTQTFFVLLAKNLGFKTNALPMQLLSERIEFTILLKNKENLFVLESILLGVAGLLSLDAVEEYPLKLQKEFSHQKEKYQFDVLQSSIWKFGGVRPSNFPTLRLMQLAKVIHLYGDLFDQFIVQISSEKNWELFNVAASSFWDTHYVFSKPSAFKKKLLGKSAVNNVLINTIAPMLFYYGKETNNGQHIDYSINLLEKIPAEKNSITEIWKQNNIFAKRAAQSQALIELTNNFCKAKKCIHCGIGIQILRE